MLGAVVQTWQLMPPGPERLAPSPPLLCGALHTNSQMARHSIRTWARRHELREGGVSVLAQHSSDPSPIRLVAECIEVRQQGVMFHYLRNRVAIPSERGVGDGKNPERGQRVSRENAHAQQLFKKASDIL